MRDFLSEGKHRDSDQQSGREGGKPARLVRLHSDSLPLEKTGDGDGFESSKKQTRVKL